MGCGVSGQWCLTADQHGFAGDALSDGLCVRLCALAAGATAWLLISHYRWGTVLHPSAGSKFCTFVLELPLKLFKLTFHCICFLSK